MAASPPPRYVDFAEQCYEMGYRAFKMHGWCDGNAQEESAAVLALGSRLRGRMSLMLDPACELRTFADTLAVGRVCDEAGFFWYSGVLMNWRSLRCANCDQPPSRIGSPAR